MIVSPDSARPSSSWKTSSVIFPLGTIIQNARGAASCDFSSASEPAVRSSTFGSYVFTSWLASRKRPVIPFPIRPSPIIPSCMPLSFASWACAHGLGPPARSARFGSQILEPDARRRAAPLLERGEVAGRLGAEQAPEPERPSRYRQLFARVVDHLQEEPGRWPALVQLARRVEVARPIAVRDDELALAVQTLDQPL